MDDWEERLCDQSDPYDWFLHRMYHSDHRKIPIREKPLIIGRGTDADFQINAQKYMKASRNHCMVQMVDGKPTITDCHSRRGTFVNDKRLDRFQPGRIELKEGDIVGIAHKNMEIQQYFKFHDNVLRYRVCRVVQRDEAVIISDDEVEDQEPAYATQANLVSLSTESSSDSSSSNDTGPEQSVQNDEAVRATASPVPGPSGLSPLAVESVPEEVIDRKSSFEMEYDQIKALDTDSEIEMCDDVPNVSYDVTEVITLSDDDEYIDVQYSQTVIKEAQEELEDDVEAKEELEDDVEPLLLPLSDWALKLKSDVDATKRYKKRAIEIKEEKESPSKREKADRNSEEKCYNQYKKHRSSGSRSSEEEYTSRRDEVAKEKESHNAPSKVMLPRSSTDDEWDVIETTKDQGKRSDENNSKSSKRGVSDGKALDPKKSAKHIVEPIPSTSREKVESLPSTSRHSNEPSSTTSRHTHETIPSSSRHTHEPTISKHRDPGKDTTEKVRTLDEKTKLDQAKKLHQQPQQQQQNKHTQQDQQPNRINNRRHSVAGWAEVGAKRPSGTIELAIPEKPKVPKALWLQDCAKPACAESTPHSATSDEVASAKPTPKSCLKRRGSISSVEEAQAMIQKKLKRRVSVSDRNLFDFQPVASVSKDQKEQRKSRLIEINAKKKQQEKGPPILIEPHSLGRKTGSTKPKVKFTPNNRGSFLTAPVPPPSRALPTSRPTATEESIVCTQSTTLEQLPLEDGLAEVVDMRPKKLTFESVARVSNVDRPTPSSSGQNRPLSFYRPITTEPPATTATTPAKPSTLPPKPTTSIPSTSSIIPTTITTPAKSSTLPLKPTTSIPSTSSNIPTTKTTPAKPSTLPLKLTTSIPSTISSKKAASAATAETEKPPTELSRPLRSILKWPESDRKTASQKTLVIREDLNMTVYIESCLDKSSPAEVEPPTEVQASSLIKLQKAIQEQILWQELDLLAEVLEWPTKWLMQPESELAANGPFASDGRMLPKLENYDSYDTFRQFHMPFLKRELWHEIYTNAKVVTASLVLRDTSVDKAEHVDLCKLNCRSRINGKEHWRSFDFGIVEYHSKVGHTCSLFVYVHSQTKDENATLRESNGGSQPGLPVIFELYATARELEGLRSARNIVFRPLSRIQLYLRRCNAISRLEHSPLLPNIISPASNKQRLANIENELKQQPELRVDVAQDMAAGALNPGQMKVVSAVLDECRSREQPTISLVQGPPGTGKSRVIGHLVLELMRLGQREKKPTKVLVCASSNTAVDVIVKNLMKLQQIKAESERFKLVRTGTKNKVDPACFPVFVDKMVQEEVLRENRLSQSSHTVGVLQDMERERDVLEKRIKQAKEELACGRNFNTDRLKDMMRKLQKLYNVLNTSGTSTGSLWEESRKKQEVKARIRILQTADIVCTTLGSCSNLSCYCPNLTFSVCIIDEATQCTELCSLLPLQYDITKMVLVGDINQLPATVLDQQCIEAGFRTSLFARLYQSYAGEGEADQLKMLKTQYRMHPNICHWPNRYFYNSQLKNAPCTEMMRKAIKLKHYMVISLSYDQELTQAQYEIYNKDEIRFVVELMRQMVRCCDKHATFAIVTPYVRQKEELIHSLRNTKLQPMVEVHSIDSVQGKEFDVVVISLARSNGAGFLNNPERINVAMTRARQCLVLCGNFSSLKHKPVWSSLLEDAEKRKVYYHLEDHDAQVDGQQMVKNIMQRLRLT
uniref:FHA domain-containing protein n=1 Tax=Anopheles epiroticus TaxID=199890 RepID=A0A182P6C1_9DIPT